MRLRRLGRVALKLTCVTTLVLAVAVAVFAVRSFWVQDLAQVAYQWYPTHDSWCARWLAVRSFRGTLGFGVVRNDMLDLPHMSSEPGWEDRFRSRNPQGFRGSYSTVPSAQNFMQVSILRPAYEHTDNPGTNWHDEYWTLTIPSPYIVLCLLIPPALYGVRMRRIRKRAQLGLCAHCGYDLRASAERCPECGTRRAPISAGEATAE
jgi:hypothetical protein